MQQSSKIFIPMIGRQYAVTETEQRWLSGRHGLSRSDLAAILHSLAAHLETNEGERQKSATKVKRQIEEACRKQ